MNCDEALQRLSVDLDEELSPLESALLGRHVAACPGCARRRRLLDQTRTAFRGADRRRGLWPLVSTLGLAAILAGSFVVLRQQARAPTPEASLVVRQVASKRTIGPFHGPDNMAAADCGKPGAVHCVVDQPCLDCGLRQPGLDLR
jgi:anti-sigma factor RsiW